jgi:hypothetical protein
MLMKETSEHFERSGSFWRPYHKRQKNIKMEIRETAYEGMD